jgi:hypothetical protein
MDIMGAVGGAAMLSGVFFLICTILLMIGYASLGKADDESLRTIAVCTTVVFLTLTVSFTSSTPHDEYLRMQNELETIQKAAVDAGLGHFKETVVVVETKKEFVIGSFTAEVIATGTKGE